MPAPTSMALMQALGLAGGEDPHEGIRQSTEAARSAISSLVGMTPLLDISRTPTPTLQTRTDVDGRTHYVGDGHNHGAASGTTRAPRGWNAQVAGQFGLRETSGYRDPAHNRRVGGVPNSFHTQRDQYGQSRAYDFVGSRSQMEAGKRWAQQNGAREAMVHAVPGGGVHLHIAF